MEITEKDTPYMDTYAYINGDYRDRHSIYVLIYDILTEMSLN